MQADEIKKILGYYAAELVKDNTTIGLGTGTTANWLIKALGDKVAKGFQCTVVPTSRQTAELAKQHGLTVSGLNEPLHMTIDGTDEIDSHGNLIKGGGGALLQEKIVASSSSELVIIADDSKSVSQLGKFPLPVEVIPFAAKEVQRKIKERYECEHVALRMRNGLPFLTDHQHYILDCQFNLISDPVALNTNLHLIPGVVETGLFCGLTTRVILGSEDGQIHEKIFTRRVIP